MPAEIKKFLFVSLEGLIGDTAWQVKKEGPEVKYYIENPKEKEVVDGFVAKTDNWEKEVDWADIIVFDDVLGQGTKAQALRAKGKLVVGGTPYTDRLEDDRGFGQEELKKAGVPILPYQSFTSFDAAIDFVQKNPNEYVIKPSGEAANQKGLLFVGTDEQGRDVLQVLNDYKTAWQKKIPQFQLQKKVSGVEVAVGAFFNGKEFIYPINVNFEHKKLFPGNLGPSTGEMGCYDDETEVLTKNGWKYFNEVNYEDEFASLHPETNQLKYHRPSTIVHYQHHKKMLQIRNRATDLLVTPDHQMFGQEANAYKKTPSWNFVAAQKLPNQFVAPRSAKWRGHETSVFTLPAISRGHYSGRTVVQKSQAEKLIPMDIWLAFLGFWLAEGWTTTKGYCVGIVQLKKEQRDYINSIIKTLPFNFRRVPHGWICDNKQLWSYLRPLGHALTKYIPAEYKQLSVRQLEILFNHMCYGDGNKQKTGFRIYYTSSKRLADDVQEILLKIGRVGIVKCREARPGRIGTRIFKTTQPAYEVIERIKKTVAWIDQRDIHTVDYGGSVHCVTVPYHTLYIRRHGKPVWCGNTSMFWSGPNRLFNHTLKKIEPKLAEENYVGYIDINCIVNGNGIYPLEWTARFGYPTLSIQSEGINMPLSEVFLNLAQGLSFKLKTKSGFQIGVVIVVPPFPYEDEKTFEVLSKDSVVFFEKPTEGVHLGDVKLVNGEWLITGTAGVPIIVCGAGQTMKQAQTQVYNRIKQINIPHMYYRMDIGDRWFEDSDKLHSWGYLREV